MSVQMAQAKIKTEGVTEIQAARELQKLVEASRAEPPNVQPLTVIGSYRLF